MSTIDKIYYAKNREHLKTKKLKRYYELKNDPQFMEKKKNYAREYYHLNREKLRSEANAKRALNLPERRIYENAFRKKQLEIKAGRPKSSVCEICGSAEKIVYDHDHATGKFRGWICFSCNTALGHARDNPEVLYKLIDYLNKSRGLVTINQKDLIGIAQPK